MNVATESSVSGSAAISVSDPPPETSEVDYLSREISDAKAALSNTLAALKNDCAASIDTRKWIRQYPWFALGAATAAGFAAATAVIPAEGETVAEKWSRLRTKSLLKSSGRSDRMERGSHGKGGRIAAKILDSLFDLTKLLIEGLIIAAVRKPPEPREPAVGASAAADDDAKSDDPRC